MTRSGRRIALVPEDLEQTLSDLGLTLGNAGPREVWACCPAHERRTGSADRRPTNFSVNRETGEFNCFACHYSGELPTLVMDELRLDPWKALSWLSDHGASYSDAVARAVNKQGPAAKKTGAWEVSMESRFAVFDAPPARELRKRKITAEAADHFEVRWDGERFVLPIRLPSGKLIGWQLKGKGIFKNFPAGVSKSTTLFGTREFAGTRAVLLESPLDVVRLWTAGYDGGLSSYGVHISTDQVRLLLHLADRVTLALDNDDDGWATTKRLAPDLRRRVPTRYLTYEGTSAKDIGEMTDAQIDAQVQGAASAFRAIA